MRTYDHRITIDQETRTISIFRVMPDGSEEFFTSTALPEGNADDNWEEISSFAKQLGENLLLDSPAARKLLGLQAGANHALKRIGRYSGGSRKGFYSIESGQAQPAQLGPLAVSMNDQIWKPITESELKELIQNELGDCSPELESIFQKYRVDLVRTPLANECGENESFFVAARRTNEVLYYEDIEEGWNFSALNEQGEIKEHWYNQDELKYALLHWAKGNS